MIKPTVGRILWYWPAPGAAFATMPGQPLAAQVSAVWSDSCVNIGFLDANGVAHSATSVLLWQEDQGTPRPAYSFLEWMPYQLQSQTGPARDLPANAPKPPPAPAPVALPPAQKANTLSLKGKR